MTILLHGENSVASRERLSALKVEKGVIEIGLTDSPPQITSLFSSESLVVIWSDKKVSATQIKSLEKTFPDLKAEEFKLDPIVFRFVESLRPGNQQTFLPFWEKYRKTDPVEVAFVMIVRQFRLMLTPSDPTLAPWLQGKIKAQAATFGLPKLKEIYKRLLQIDYDNKTGKSPMDFQTSLELLLLTL